MSSNIELLYDKFFIHFGKIYKLFYELDLDLSDLNKIKMKAILRTLIANTLIPTKLSIEKIILEQNNIKDINKFELFYKNRNNFERSFNEIIGAIISIIVQPIIQVRPELINENYIIESCRNGRSSKLIEEYLSNGKINDDDIIKLCRYFDCFVDIQTS